MLSLILRRPREREAKGTANDLGRLRIRLNNAMFKWFWTIFSLGAPDYTPPGADSAPDAT